MNNPEIQNDFSFYRRTFSRTKKRPILEENRGQGGVEEGTPILSEELANRMSLFFAVPNPMFTSVKIFLQDLQNESYYGVSAGKDAGKELKLKPAPAKANTESQRIRTILLGSFAKDRRRTIDEEDFEDSLEELAELCETFGPLTAEEKEMAFGIFGQSLVMSLQRDNQSYTLRLKDGKSKNNIDPISLLTKEEIYVARFTRIFMTFILLFCDHLTSTETLKLINFKVALDVLVEQEIMWDSAERGTGGEETTRLLNLFKYSSASLADDSGSNAKIAKKLQKIIDKRTGPHR